MATVDAAAPLVLIPAFLLSLLVFVYVRSVVDWRTRTRGRPLPPGPKPLPLLGNVLNMPKSKAWVVCRDLCVKYGDILHFRSFGQSYVVLGSSDVIFAFLDKQSGNTAARKMNALTELTGVDRNFGFQTYGPSWRHHRRAFWQHFTPRAIIEYQPVQRAMAHQFLLKLLQNPSRLVDHIRYTFFATIMKLLYDIDIVGEDDKYIALVQTTLEGVVQGLVAVLLLIM